MKKIKSALISVFNKDRIDEICTHLSSNNVTIYSTGWAPMIIFQSLE
jgi:AICAR transformylase/IMP cyclohydrolase PurH